MFHCSKLFFLLEQRACAWERRNVGIVAQQMSTPLFMETSPCSKKKKISISSSQSGIPPPTHQSDPLKTTDSFFPFNNTNNRTNTQIYDVDRNKQTWGTRFMPLWCLFFIWNLRHIWRHTLLCDPWGSFIFQESEVPESAHEDNAYPLRSMILDVRVNQSATAIWLMQPRTTSSCGITGFTLVRQGVKKMQKRGWHADRTGTHGAIGRSPHACWQDVQSAARTPWSSALHRCSCPMISWAHRWRQSLQNSARTRGSDHEKQRNWACVLPPKNIFHETVLQGKLDWLCRHLVANLRISMRNVKWNLEFSTQRAAVCPQWPHEMQLFICCVF